MPNRKQRKARAKRDAEKKKEAELANTNLANLRALNAFYTDSRLIFSSEVSSNTPDPRMPI